MAGQEPDVGLASLSSSTEQPVTPESATPGPVSAESATPVSASADDETWFRQLFAEAYGPLVAYTRRRTSDWSEADDIVSEVFTIAWRRRDERRTDRPSLPWLYGIAANVARNHWRSSGRRLRLVDHLEAQPRSQETQDPAEQSASSLRHALGQLSFDDQEVLRLVAWEGLGHAEVAEVLDCSTNAVGIRVHRARQRLQQQLDVADVAETDPQTTDPPTTDSPTTTSPKRRPTSEEETS